MSGSMLKFLLQNIQGWTFYKLWFSALLHSLHFSEQGLSSVKIENLLITMPSVILPVDPILNRAPSQLLWGLLCLLSCVTWAHLPFLLS